MSMQYQSNVSRIAGSVKARLIALQQNPDLMLRTVALAVLPELKKRVHVEGRDSSGGQIGRYSPGYMQVRTGNYSNSGRVSKGKNKGKLKDPGTISRGPNKGQARPKYNRSSDTKVILSLTRQMENDLSVVASGTGYGLGYNNPENFQKSQFNELTYKRKIWNLTDEEKKLVKTVAETYITDFLNSK